VQFEEINARAEAREEQILVVFSKRSVFCRMEPITCENCSFASLLDVALRFLRIHGRQYPRDSSTGLLEFNIFRETKVKRFGTKLTLAGALLGVGAGCSETREALPNEPVSAQIATPMMTSAPLALDSLSRGLARALAVRANRFIVLSAMRGSRFVDGQVDAATFFSRTSSRQLVRDIEKANGWLAGTLASRVRAYPGIALQLPFRSHRLAWTGDGLVRVAGLLNTESELARTFRSDGESSVLTPDEARGQSEAFVLLAPSEATDERAQSRSTGAIEIVGEALAAKRITYVSSSGDTTITTLQQVISGQDRNLTVSSLNGSNADSTKLGFFQANGYQDGYGALEMRLRTKFYRPDGSLDGEVTYERNDVTPGTAYNLDDLLISRRIPDASGARINIEVWEDDCDCFGNDDDYYGQRSFIIGDRGQTRSIFGDPAGIINVASDITNIRLDWTAKPAPIATSLALAISQYEIPVGGVTSFNAAVFDQYGYIIPGASPSSWSAYQPGVLDIASSGGGAIGTGVTVGGTVVSTSYGNLTGSAYITVSDAGPPCPDNQVQCNQTRAKASADGRLGTRTRRP
jgi:hypothetical protein